MNVGSGRHKSNGTLRIKSLAERRANRPKRVYIMPSDAESKYKEATKFQETKCSFHQVKITSFCNNCGNFVCNVCKQPAHGHDGHDFMSATEKTNELKELVREHKMMIAERALNPVKRSISEINSIQYNMESNCDDLIRAVDEREQELIREIEKCSRRLKADIERKQIKYSPALASKLANLEDSKIKIDNELKSCDNIIYSGNSYDLLAWINSSSLSLDFNSAPISIRAPLQYEFHIHRPFYVEELFGKIRQLRVLLSHDNIKVTNSRKYDIYLENVVARKDCIWINKTGCFVSLKPKTGQEIDRKVCSVCPSSFVVTTSGEIIYTIPHEHNIYKTTQAMTVKLKHTYPYSPSGLCLAISGGFYVTLHKEKSDGKIVRYFNEDCKDWLELSCYRERKSLLKMPTKITENGNKDVWVIDAVSASVFAINSVGKFKFEFKGSEKNFEPVGICTDCRHNVLISDFRNKLIDILADDGQLLSSIKLERLGISRPMGLSITKDGELCVGQGNGWMHFLRYSQ